MELTVTCIRRCSVHFCYSLFVVFLKSRADSDEEFPRFNEFLLVVEQEDSERTIGDSTPGAGILQVFGDSLTKSSSRCPNSVQQTDSLPKSEIQVKTSHTPTLNHNTLTSLFIRYYGQLHAPEADVQHSKRQSQNHQKCGTARTAPSQKSYVRRARIIKTCSRTS